jgi:hypothetical protein
MMPPELLLELLAARLALLDSTLFQQTDADAYVDSWHESRNPFSGDEPGSIRHLAFTVLIPSSINTEESEGDTGTLIRARSQVDVLFEYMLRNDTQNTDLRLAYRAARKVLSAVNDESWADGLEEVVPNQLSRPQIAADGLSARMLLTFQITHEYEV